MVFTIVELLVIVLVAVVLMAVLTQVFSRGAKPAEGGSSAASVKLERTARDADGREETLLLVNERVILAANNDGVRLSDYADNVEQLEAVAARLAAALGVTVAFTRVGGQKTGDEKGIFMRDLPRTTDEEVDTIEARRRPGNASQRQGS